MRCKTLGDIQDYVAVYRSQPMGGKEHNSPWFYGELICSYLKKGDFVLDVGCGDGGQFGIIKEKIGSGRLLGVDATPEYVDSAKKYIRDGGLKKTRAIIWDGRAMGQILGKQKPDKILLVQTLHCMAKPNVYLTLDEVIRRCSEDGEIIIANRAKEHFRVFYDPEGSEEERSMIKTGRFPYCGVEGTALSKEEFGRYFSDRGYVSDLREIYPQEIDPRNLRLFPSIVRQVPEFYVGRVWKE